VSASPPPLLRVSGLDAWYGDFQALFDVSVSVAEGEVVAIIGANGAGKSTLLGTIAGLLPRTAGSVTFDGRELAGMPAHRRVALGISMVPEGRRIFPSLSVEENLLVGAQARRPGPWTVAAVLELFPLLADKRQRGGGQLSGGEQQALAIGRGLMANPRLLLLDEVSLGLAPIVVRRIYEALPAIRAAGITVMLVEQDIGQALGAADRVYCLLEGRVALESAPAELDRDRIAAAYFGVRA
jgi:branched-chain amino acid transport system ATP-binding protein